MVASTSFPKIFTPSPMTLGDLWLTLTFLFFICWRLPWHLFRSLNECFLLIFSLLLLSKTGTQNNRPDREMAYWPTYGRTHTRTNPLVWLVLYFLPITKKPHACWLNSVFSPCPPQWLVEFRTQKKEKAHPRKAAKTHSRVWKIIT